MNGYPDFAAALQDWNPDPRAITRDPQQEMEPDGYAPDVQPAFPENPGSTGDDSPYAAAWSQSYLQHPLEPPRHGSNLQQFLTHATARLVNLRARRMAAAHENSPKNPAARKALAAVNLRNIKATIEARNAIERQGRENRTERRSIRSDARADRADARAEAASAREAARFANPSRTMKLTPEEMGEADATRIKTRNRSLRAGGERVSSDAKPPKPPHVYVQDKIAQAMRLGMSASAFEAAVRKDIDKIRAAGLNPDSLIEKGWRSLPKN